MKTRSGRSGRNIALGSLVLGILIGSALGISPASAHIGDTISHLWTHLKPLTDNRYFKKDEEAVWAYGNIREDATIRSGSSRVVSVDHVTGSGIYCINFSETRAGR